jgi:hypothetical protein
VSETNTTLPTYPAQFEDAVKEADLFQSQAVEAQKEYDAAIANLMDYDFKGSDGEAVAGLAQLAFYVRTAKFRVDVAIVSATSAEGHAKRLLVNSGILHRWCPYAHKQLTADIAEENRKLGV